MSSGPLPAAAVPERNPPGPAWGRAAPVLLLLALLGLGVLAWQWRSLPTQGLPTWAIPAAQAPDAALVQGAAGPTLAVSTAGAAWLERPWFWASRRALPPAPVAQEEPAEPPPVLADPPAPRYLGQVGPLVLVEWNGAVLRLRVAERFGDFEVLRIEPDQLWLKTPTGQEQAFPLQRPRWEQFQVDAAGPSAAVTGAPAGSMSPMASPPATSAPASPAHRAAPPAAAPQAPNPALRPGLTPQQAEFERINAWRLENGFPPL